MHNFSPLPCFPPQLFTSLSSSHIVSCADILFSLAVSFLAPRKKKISWFPSSLRGPLGCRTLFCLVFLFLPSIEFEVQRWKAIRKQGKRWWWRGGVEKMLSSMRCRKPASQQAVCLQSWETWRGAGEVCEGVRHTVAPPDREPFY